MNREEATNMKDYFLYSDSWEMPDGDLLKPKARMTYDKELKEWVVYFRIDAKKYTFVEVNQVIQVETFAVHFCDHYDFCDCKDFNSSLTWSANGKEYIVRIW